MRIYSRWRDGKIKHRKGRLLNLIPGAIFIVVATGCADRARKKKKSAVFKLWQYSLLIFNIIRKSLENHHKTWDYDQSIKHNDYSVYFFSASPRKWDLLCCGYVGGKSKNIFHNYSNIWRTLACMNYYTIMQLCLSAQKQCFIQSLVLDGVNAFLWRASRRKIFYKAFKLSQSWC